MNFSVCLCFLLLFNFNVIWNPFWSPWIFKVNGLFCGELRLWQVVATCVKWKVVVWWILLIIIGLGLFWIFSTFFLWTFIQFFMPVALWAAKLLVNADRRPYVNVCLSCEFNILLNSLFGFGFFAAVGAAFVGFWANCCKVLGVAFFFSFFKF